MSTAQMKGIGRWAARAAQQQGGNRAVDRDSRKWFLAQKALYPDLDWAPFIDGWWDEALDMAGAPESFRRPQ